MKQKFYFNLIKNHFLLFSIVVLLLLPNSSNLFGQVVIKERVEIEPSKTTPSKTSTTVSETHTLKAVVPWDGSEDVRVKIKIENSFTGEFVESGYDYSGNAEVSMTATKARGYSVDVNIQGYYNYGDVWVDILMAHIVEIYADGKLYSTGGTIRPWFSKLIFSSDENELSCSGQTDIIFGEEAYKGDIAGTFVNNTVKLSIIGGDDVLLFYDNQLGVNLGSSATYDYLNYHDIDLKLNAPYIEENDKEVIITAEMDGHLLTDTLTIKTTKEYTEYSINPPSNSRPNVYRGDLRSFTATTSRGGSCGFEYETLPEEIKYNLVITKGGEHGYISFKQSSDSTISGTDLYDLENSYGRIRFKYQSYFEPFTKDTVIINISTTDSDIEPVDVELYLAPNPFYVYSDPDPVTTGDTTKIIMKQFVDSVGYVDFPEDHEFYILLWEGYKYGDLYSSFADKTHDWYFEDTPGDFSFVAVDNIDEDYATVLVWVETFIDHGIYGTSSLSKSGANNNIFGENKSLPSKEIRKKIRKEAREKIKKERQLDVGEGHIIYEKDNSAITEIMQSSVPLAASPALELVSTEFEISVKRKLYAVRFNLSIIPDTLSEKDTLAFAEGATLFVQAVDSAGDKGIFAQSNVLKLSIPANDEYLRFVDETGDTLGAEINEIEKPYYVFNSKKIKIVAIEENPTTVDSCLLKVMSIKDTSFSGKNTAVILEQTLKIVMEDSLVVQPIITSRYGDVESETYLGSINNNNRKPFKIKLTRGGETVDTFAIKLTTDYIDSSGGHYHITPRRPNSEFTYTRPVWENGKRISREFNISTETARRVNYGSFYSYKSGETFDTDSLKGMIYERSREDTVTRFEYVASIWGDSIKIKLTSAKYPYLYDSVLVVERIPDLVALGTNEEIYSLIGGTPRHNGPPDYQVDHNHYGTAATNANIREIASDYFQRFQQRLDINDISLPYGGKFDVSTDMVWNFSHQTHREGRNVDIRSRNMHEDEFLDDNRNGAYDPNERLLRDWNGNGQYDRGAINVFRIICEDNEATKILLENPGGNNEHWHLQFKD